VYISLAGRSLLSYIIPNSSHLHHCGAQLLFSDVPPSLCLFESGMVLMHQYPSVIPSRLNTADVMLTMIEISLVNVVIMCVTSLVAPIEHLISSIDCH